MQIARIKGNVSTNWDWMNRNTRNGDKLFDGSSRKNWKNERKKNAVAMI